MNIWAKMQKVLQTWSFSLKNVHIAISNKVSELKADRGLFGRIAANSRPDMHLQECLSNYELSKVPKLLFAVDETILYCSAKSKLMDILEKMSSAETSVVSPPDIPQPNKCVMIIHAFSQWTNPAGLRCAKICQLSSSHLYKENIMNRINFIILFDRYDFQNHLSQQEGTCGLVILTLWHITAQTFQQFKCFTEETVIPHSNKGLAYSIFVKRIAEILKREQIVYRCMAK